MLPFIKKTDTEIRDSHYISTMKKTITTLFCACGLLASAQQVPELHPGAAYMIEEKVRDTSLRELMMELLANPADTKVQAALGNYMANRPGPMGQRGEDVLTGGAEPYITMHPANPNHLVLSYMEAGSTFEYPVYYSTDAGVSWTRSTFSSSATLATEFSGHNIYGGGDPVFGFDEDGTLHMTYIYLHGVGFNIKAGMFYVYSTDGGITFTIPSGGAHVILDGTLFLPTDMLDRQWMDVDNTGGALDGNVYMSSVYFGGIMGNAGEVVVVKPASATAFNDTAYLAVPSGTGEGTQFGNIKVDPSGTVHLSCMKFDSNSGAGGVYYTRSNDGALTWDTPVLIGNATTSLPNGGNHLIHDRDNSAVSLAVDGSNIYIAWSDMADSTVRAFTAHSNDGGTTWSAPYEFGTDLLDTNYYHLMPNVSAEGGKAALAWYAVNKADMITNYYMAESSDAGATYSVVNNISQAPTDFANEGSGFYGDYNSSVRNGCNVYAAWGDGRTGNPEMYVARIDACNLTVQEINPVHAGWSVKLYPNPAQTGTETYLDITGSEEQEYRIEIYDLSGKNTVQATKHNGMKGTGKVVLNTKGLNPGTYFVRISDNGGTYAIRTLILTK